MSYLPSAMCTRKYRYNHEVVRVPVEFILQNTVESCDYVDFDGSVDDWMKIIFSKSSDTGFGHLVESMIENGFMEKYAMGLTWEDGGLKITEGHHRLVAAILLGMDFVYASAYSKGRFGPEQICAHYNDVDPHPITL